MIKRFNKIILKGHRVYLRPMLEKDTEFIVKSRNDSRVRQWLFNSESLTIESHLNWFSKQKNNRLDFVICLNKSNVQIGTLNFIEIDLEKKEAELGKMLAPEYWGKGYIQDALPLWFEFGFNVLNLKQIFAKTLSSNIKNIRLNQKYGFSIKEVVDDNLLEKNKEAILMSLTKDNFVK